MVKVYGLKSMKSGWIFFVWAGEPTPSENEVVSKEPMSDSDDSKSDAESISSGEWVKEQFTLANRVLKNCALVQTVI